MVNLYYPVHCDWIIPVNELKKLKDGTDPEMRLPKTIIIEDKTVIIHFRVFKDFYLRRNKHPRLSCWFFIITEIDQFFIAFSIKETNFKVSFNRKRDLWPPTSMYLPEDLLDPEKDYIKNNNIYFEISGMLIEKVCSFPPIHRLDSIDVQQWRDQIPDFNICIVNAQQNKRYIRIHKSILIEQSEYFSALFNSGLEESVTNTVTIPDFAYEVVEAFINFFYNREIERSISVENLCELLRMADKYQMIQLFDSVIDWISPRLTPSNVFLVKEYANLFNNCKLGDYCDKFIRICSKREFKLPR